ncbi:MAG: APC family permease [Acidobacteria bacterium]|nr:APC family permease [Acidobacteriota bacterium]
MSGQVGRYGRKVGFLGLVIFLYASLSSGAAGIEEIVAASGPGMAMWLFLILPIVWGLPNVLINSEMSSAIPVEGGYYRWCRRALGPFWGFVSGWWVWVASIFDNVIYPVVVADYCAVMWGALGGPGARSAIVVGLIVIFGYLNFRGMRAVVLSSAVFTVLVLVPLVIFVLLAIPLATRNPFEPLLAPGNTSVGGLGIALILAMWFYAGYELPSTAAEEYERSHRTLPRGLMLLLVFSVLGYVLPLGAALAVDDNWAVWKDGSLAVVADQVGAAHGGPLMGIALGVAMTVSAAVGSMAVFNGLLVPYSRLPMAMAEDGEFPRVFARLHPRYRTPWVAILVNCALYASLHWLDFTDLVLLSMWTTLFAYLVIYAALIVLRRCEPELPRPSRIPGGRLGLALVITPAVFLIFWGVWQSARENWLAGDIRVLVMGAIGILSGPVVYWVKGMFRTVRGLR